MSETAPKSKRTMWTIIAVGAGLLIAIIVAVVVITTSIHNAEVQRAVDQCKINYPGVSVDYFYCVEIARR